MDVNELVKARLDQCLNVRIVRVLPSKGREGRQVHVGMGLVVDMLQDLRFVSVVLLGKVSHQSLG